MRFLEFLEFCRMELRAIVGALHGLLLDFDFDFLDLLACQRTVVSD